MNYLYTMKDMIRRRIRYRYFVEVEKDDCHTNPMENWDNIKMIIDTRFCKMSNCDEVYTLEQLIEKSQEIFGVELDRENVIPVAMKESAAKAGYTMMPVWCYSHSGYTFAAAYENPFDKWDSGLAGFIWCEKCFGDEETLKLFTKEFDGYFNDEVYHIRITDIKDDELIDDNYDVYLGDKKTLEKYCEDMLGEGTLEEYEGEIETVIDEEGLIMQVEDVLEDYRRNGLPKEKVALLKLLLN